ncbi:MAG: DUF6677 family protein [Gemmataceae bacterium]
MANATLTEKPIMHIRPPAYGAGFLSYLVPGLGQITQGRVGKGLLFLVCIYTLFFYGVYLGTGSVTIDGKTFHVSSNVYLPDAAEDPQPGAPRQLPPLLQNLYARPQFAGQFWVGVAAWPAIIQYMSREDPRQRRLDDDAPAEGKRGHPQLGEFMREPDPVAVNAVHNAGDKRLELAWVYTVIAGVLNILVIYDAVAGPAFGQAGGPEKKD